MNPGDVRALIVEDDRSWQQILSEILTDVGLAVDVADSLETAIASLRAVPHRLAVVDLSLSGRDHYNQDGLRVLDAVRYYDPGCATILLTGYATVELAVSALSEHGAFTCLRKEAFRRAEFREVIQQTLASTPALEDANGPQVEAFSGDSLATDVEREKSAPDLALVVEDDAGWRSILSELLADAGYRVRLCSSYGEALGCLRRERYGLAVIDLSLSGSFGGGGRLWDYGESGQELDGYRLLASTRAGGTPTIVVSGVGTPDDIERAYTEHGIFAYLEKRTFNRRLFLQTVDEARTACRASGELDCLTGREREVLELLARGLTNKEMAQSLVITTNTVKRHLKSIFSKLEVHTRSAAVAKAVSAGVSTEWPGADAEKLGGGRNL